MIVHQQLAALAGGKSSKKMMGVELPMEEGDPLFSPNSPTIRKKKKTKKLKSETVKPKKPVIPTTPVTAKKNTSK